MLQPTFLSGKIEAGCDEAGRGCIAGPVFAAAVILPANYSNKAFNDSKKISEAQRDLLRQTIEKEALSWAVAAVSPEEIDEINILQASIRAMHLALDKLDVRPECIAVDGNRFRPYHGIPYHTLVKGDGRFQNIAAASILAKTHRDAYMKKLHDEFPVYGWNKNKGYPTREHRDAVARYGNSPFHRTSFRLRSLQLSMFNKSL